MIIVCESFHISRTTHNHTDGDDCDGEDEAKADDVGVVTMFLAKARLPNNASPGTVATLRFTALAEGAQGAASEEALAAASVLRAIHPSLNAYRCIPPMPVARADLWGSTLPTS